MGFSNFSFRVGCLQVALPGGLPGECLTTEAALEAPALRVFLPEVPLEVGLGSEHFATPRADFSEAQVLGLDVDLQVAAGVELPPTDLADQVRPGPGGVFASPVSRQVPLTLPEVVTAGLRAGEGRRAVEALSVSSEVSLPAVGLPAVVTGQPLPGVDPEVSLQADLLSGLVAADLTLELSFPTFLLPRPLFGLEVIVIYNKMQ